MFLFHGIDTFSIIDEQRLLDHFLNGIMLTIHRPESHVIKEKKIRLAHTMKSLYWPSRNAPNRVHVLELKTICVCFAIVVNYFDFYKTIVIYFSFST